MEQVKCNNGQMEICKNCKHKKWHERLPKCHYPCEHDSWLAFCVRKVKASKLDRAGVG